ncbi:MAG: hypothetical protein ACXWHB_07525 [Usitatibacter sp.]
MPTRFIRNVLVAAAVILGIAGAINYRVDPFQQYRVPSKYTPRFYYSFQRYENPGIARNYDFDRALVSSSFLENVSGSEVDRAFGHGKTFNLAFSALTAYEARKLLESALSHGRVKEVIYNVDYNSFAGGLNRTGTPDPLPLYLYDNRRWNDYPYLLSIATLRKAANILLGRHEMGYREDRDNPWYWGDTAEFSVKSVVEHLDFRDLNKRFRQPQRTIEGMMASFDANLVPLVRDHPDVKFVFLWPPYSILVWADFRQRGQLDLSLEFKKRFVETLSKYPNVRIQDFQERTDWITRLDEYRDMYHFSPRISSAVVAELGAGHDLLTPANVDERNRRLRELAMAADPERIIADALAAAPAKRD